MRLTEYILKRILLIIPTFFLMTAIVFYAGMIIGWGGVGNLPRNVHVEYFRYIFALLQGDFGHAWGRVGARNATVSAQLALAIPNTFILVSGATIVASVTGITLGIIAALKQNKIADGIIMVSTLFAASFPLFFLAPVLVLFFRNTSLPFIGLNDWQSAILPILTLSIPAVGFIARTTRIAMLEVLNMPCITAVRARGLPERHIILSHAAANMRIPIVTALSVRLAELFMGTVLVEAFFAIPGLGRLLLTSVGGRDLPLAMGSIIVLAMIFIITNIIVDILYVTVDPRTKRSFR